MQHIGNNQTKKGGAGGGPEEPTEPIHVYVCVSVCVYATRRVESEMLAQNEASKRRYKYCKMQIDNENTSKTSTSRKNKRERDR